MPVLPVPDDPVLLKIPVLSGILVLLEILVFRLSRLLSGKSDMPDPTPANLAEDIQ